MMEKRYQIFISSTFTDLEEERRMAIETIMNLGHFPIGMELFNAANDSQWEYIRRKIDEADYYILILGDRYGSVDSDGIGFTEKEYRYALSKKIPTISFVMSEKRIQDLKFENRESENRDKLKLFRTLATSKMCRIWSTEYELMSGINSGLYELFNNYPRTGWIKAANVEYEKIQNDYILLLKESSVIKEKLESLCSASERAKAIIAKFEHLTIQLRELQLTGFQVLKYFAMFFMMKNEDYRINSAIQKFCENTMNINLSYQEVGVFSMLFFKYDLLDLVEYDKGKNVYPRITTFYIPKPIFYEVLLLLKEDEIQSLPIISEKKKKLNQLDKLINEYTNIECDYKYHDKKQMDILRKIVVHYGTPELINKYNDINGLNENLSELYKFFSDIKRLYME